MRLSSLMLCFSFLLFSSFSNQKLNNEEIILTGLRFDKDRTESLKKTPKQAAFILDKNGVLRPTKNYQLIYIKAEKALVILPKTMSYRIYKQIDGIEFIDLPGIGIVGCMCDGDSDNCHFDNSKKEEEFVCTGSCRCYIGILFDMAKPPSEYETAGGRWFNF